jgi:endonuclease/exonuclease/phosphatase family metal-dependent hydrolase
MSTANHPTRLRVMTYNIHHGEGVDGKIDLPRLADVINREQPDVVALQEVDLNTRRSGGVDQVAELARLTNLHGKFARARPYDGGEYGQAVLSRWPVASLKVYPLPAGTVGPATQPVEKRIAWVAKIQLPNTSKSLEFVGTHLHHANNAYRLMQARELIDVLNTLDDPIVVGDFNAEPRSESIVYLQQSLREASPDQRLTFPSSQPTKKIDWVFIKDNSSWQAVSSDVVRETKASDHRPVVVEFQRSAERRK